MSSCRCMTVATRVWTLWLSLVIYRASYSSPSAQSNSSRRVLRLHAHRREPVCIRVFGPGYMKYIYPPEGKCSTFKVWIHMRGLYSRIPITRSRNTSEYTRDTYRIHQEIQFERKAHHFKETPSPYPPRRRLVAALVNHCAVLLPSAQEALRRAISTTGCSSSIRSSPPPPPTVVGVVLSVASAASATHAGCCGIGTGSTYAVWFPHCAALRDSRRSCRSG